MKQNEASFAAMTKACEVSQSETDNLLTSGAALSNIRAVFSKSIESSRIAAPGVALSGGSFSASQTFRFPLCAQNSRADAVNIACYR
jgi:hypothetical protein